MLIPMSEDIFDFNKIQRNKYLNLHDDISFLFHLLVCLDQFVGLQTDLN